MTLLSLFLVFLLLVPTSGVFASNARPRNDLSKRDKHHHEHNILVELPTATRRAYGSNLANGTATEREILMEFYYATNGPQWYDSPGNNWGSSMDHCKEPSTIFKGWTGIECDDEGRVAKIDIQFNNQSGYLPNSMGGLTSLDYLQLAFGTIGGGVPHELFELRNITWLSIIEHEVNGTLPATLNDDGALDKLEVLQLQFNKLSGEIPELHLPSLWAFYLHENEFSGKIPSLDNVPQLQLFVLFNNKLEGNIPSLDDDPQLQALGLYNNNFEGNITPLNHLTQLQYLDLYNNKLSGPLPNIDNLHQLADIRIYSNEFTGPLPTNFSNFLDLKTFLVYNNNFDGELSNTIFDLQQLEIAILSGNKNLKGTLPTAISSPALVGFVAEGCSLSGDLPQKISSKLTSLYLAGNDFSSTIPPLPPTILDVSFANKRLHGSLDDDFFA